MIERTEQPGPPTTVPTSTGKAKNAEGGPTTDQRFALRGFRRIRAGLVVSDAISLIAALIAFQLLHSHPGRAFSAAFVLLIVLAPLGWVGVFHAFGLYGVQYLSASEEFRRIISATTVGVVIIMIGSIWWSETLSRAWLGWTWLFALVFEFFTRRLWRWEVRRLKRKGRLVLRTLIAGTNGEAQELAHILGPPVRGFSPIGYVSVSDTIVVPDGLPVVGRVESLAETIRQFSIECVLVASTAVSSKDMLHISRACRQLNIEMMVSANLPEILTSRLTIQQIDRVMALSVRPVRLSGTQAALKRSFDLVLACAGLLVCLPFMAAIGAVIRLTSPGPSLFRQQRMTKNGHVFTMYKFRTMVRDADRALQDGLVDLTKPFFKLRDDPRLTPVGRILRMFSLDELPQLWNVVRGDMSLVGPRALRIEQIDADPEFLSPRHEVKAGLTGWWQIHGRSEVDFQEAVRMDLFYIENWSLTLDLYILLKTIGTVLAARGAY